MRWIGCSALCVLALCCAFGCTGEVGERRGDEVMDEPPRDAGGISSDGSREVDAGPDPALCRGVTSGARATFDAHCVECHGLDGAGPATTRNILDVGALLESGMVIPYDPAESPIYQRLVAGTMPPSSRPRLSVDEITYVAQWISCGAPDWAAR